MKRKLEDSDDKSEPKHKIVSHHKRWTVTKVKNEKEKTNLDNVKKVKAKTAVDTVKNDKDKMDAESEESSLHGEVLQEENSEVIIEADDGKDFKADPEVLSKESEYFRAMFEPTGFEERVKKKIRLHGVPAVALDPILNYLHGKELWLTTANVHDIVIAADYLLLDDLSQLCINFMAFTLNKTPTSTEVLKIWQTANNMSRSDLIANAWLRLRNNFKVIRKCQHFLSLSLQEIISILSYGYLHVTEVHICKAAATWLQHNNERRQHITEVMNCVRFSMIDTNTLKEYLQKFGLMSGYVPCQRIMKGIIESRNHQSLALQTELNQVKHVPFSDGIFCLVGQKFYGFMREQNKWHSLAPLPVDMERLFQPGNPAFSISEVKFNLVSAGGNLYAVCSMKVPRTAQARRASQSKYKTYLVADLQSYDFKNNHWIEEVLPSSRQNIVFLALKGNLIACSSGKVELYNATSKEWKIAARGRFGHYEFAYAKGDYLTLCYISRGKTMKVNFMSGICSIERSGYTVNGVVKEVSQIDKHSFLFNIRNEENQYTQRVFHLVEDVMIRRCERERRNWGAMPSCSKKKRISNSTYLRIDANPRSSVWVIAPQLPIRSGQPKLSSDTGGLAHGSARETPQGSQELAGESAHGSQELAGESAHGSQELAGESAQASAKESAQGSENDGFISFYKVTDKTWQCMPSIPEHKLSSLVSLRAHYNCSNTTAACLYW